MPAAASMSLSALAPLILLPERRAFAPPQSLRPLLPALPQLPTFSLVRMFAEQLP